LNQGSELKTRNAFASAVVCALVLVAAGCSAATQPTTAASPTAIPTLTAAEAEGQFKTIARASCEEALEKGTLEKSVDPGGFTLVMVPKADAYKDFSAAYFQPDDTYELIWETDAFSACGASMTYDLAEEAGQDSDLEVIFNAELQQFETFQDLGEFGVSRLGYEILDGKISSVQDLETEDSAKRTVTYGNLTEAELNILTTAVERFLAD
jgi:hypothetical protein